MSPEAVILPLLRGQNCLAFAHRTSVWRTNFSSRLTCWADMKSVQRARFCCCTRMQSCPFRINAEFAAFG